MLKTVFALLACVLVCAPPALHAAAAPPVLRNAGFEQKDASTGAPADWRVGGTGHQARVECKPDCVLRLEPSPAHKAGDFTPLMQNLPLGGAAGHKLILSGAIRTEKIDEGGFAALWLRVDGATGIASFDNMMNKAPKGDTGWTPFEVAVSVPPNASGIMAGVMIKGSGNAWFSKLQLRVDESVVVPHLARLDVKVPPRPVPSQALLDDTALQLAKGDIPAIPAAWRDDVLARRQVIRSLFSDDFSDLQFLKPLLAGKRVIQLGESGHGVAEFNWMKARLIRFLHKEMGFDVLAFESSLDQCYEADRIAGTIEAQKLMQRCIFGVWHNAEVATVFDHLTATRKGGGKLTLAGFDTQDSTWYDGARVERMRGMVEALDSPLGKTLEAMEAELRGAKRPLGSDAGAKLLGYYRDIVALLGSNRARLLAAGKKAEEVDLTLQAASSRVRYVQQLASPMGGTAGPAIRDEGMADNLDFLLDTMYPQRKVIVWAHNAHIAKGLAAGAPKMMGAHVAERRKAEVYTIGLYMNRGAANMNNQKTYQIVPAAPDTMEAALANGGVKYAFVDFSRATPGAGADWIFKPIMAREWGTNPARITPADNYDAVIYIDTVTPPGK